MSEDDTYKRGLKAARDYLERQGMTIMSVERDTSHGQIPILTLDGEWLVRVEVLVDPPEGPGPPKLSLSGAKMYHEQVQEILEMTGLDLGVRLDQVTIIPIEDDRALLKHYRNVDQYVEEDPQ